MEEYSKLINRLLDRVDNAEKGELHTRNLLMQQNRELKELKTHNDRLSDEIFKLKQPKELEE